ncbi:uncharacterized protein LOC120129431 [Hibiscus syriacus]|uniref:uncharacterized protein LOC120129431 n=1 Tax=Hibiscus syriacus TaxID=106335 RepID=UPI0019227B9F|nr:uncharacterized protein LOC120129431 [Hibiscus syriacus]
MGKPGPAIYTDVTIDNCTNENLSLYDEVDWYGFANRPLVIPAQMSEKIKHQADSQTGDSKGGVAYTIKKNIRWVVAWSNMKDKDNMVYIDITETDEKIDWNFYQSLLDTSDSNPEAVNKYRNTTVANIDPSSVTPLMRAALNPALNI